MRAAVVAFVAVATVAVGTGPMRADDSSIYLRDARTEYIGGALAAMDALGPDGLDALYREVLQGSRSVCRADFAPPTISCMLEMADQLCAAKPDGQQSGCRTMADVIVTNMLSEKEFISDADRLSLMNEGDNFRNAMLAELRARYAPLVVGLAVSLSYNAGEGLAPAIDEFCEIHASTHYLVWQRCVAAVLWYIGTEDAEESQ